ncbi:TetR family transcriptional regulator [Rhodococcus hoagii]|nr:TetR family transcriptional regulator [Prescottella equi]
MTGLERSAQPAGRSRAGSERRTKTRAKVLDAAERLMAVDLDWDRLRVEDIAAEANVSPASIYTHSERRQAWSQPPCNAC